MGLNDHPKASYTIFIVEAASEAVKNLQQAGDTLTGYGESTVKYAKAAVEATKNWIQEHPREAATIAAFIVAVPLSIAATPKVLAAIGFGEGITLGSLVTVWQSAIGDVAKNSLFSILQSAGAGGAGLVTVQKIAAGVVTTLGVFTATPGLIKTFMEGNHERKLKAKL